MHEEPEIIRELRKKEKQGLLKNKSVSNETESLDALLENDIESVVLENDLFDSLLKNIPDSIYF